ncbi:MAG TPA: glycosyltransferase [Chitinophagaceae bacterium]|nr:glycosyltransferase [Chitinophagaceae bacterium]
MKIVHVVEPLAGGMVTFISSLVENLPEDTHIVVHGPREHLTPLPLVKKQFTYPTVRFIRWPSARRSISLQKDIPAFFELYSTLKRLKERNMLDVVHLHCSKGGFIGRLVCRLLGLQHLVIYTPNGAPFMAGNNAISNFIYKKLEKVASLFGGQVVCCSPSEQKAYEQEGIPAITINNGIPYKKIRHHKKPVKKHAGFVVVTSGRIVDQKNPALFNQIAQYFEEFPDFTFLWVGDGDARDTLTASNIVVTGWLPPTKVNDLVAAADVYISTSRYEGLSFAVLEALAMNMPVLLTDCIGNRDLMNSLNGAVFTDFNDAVYTLLRFYNNSSMLKVMGQHSGAHCKNNFNLADTFSRYAQLYQRASFVPELLYPIK